MRLAQNVFGDSLYLKIESLQAAIFRLARLERTPAVEFAGSCTQVGNEAIIDAYLDLFQRVFVIFYARWE
jgi:hypothetical protein